MTSKVIILLAVLTVFSSQISAQNQPRCNFWGSIYDVFYTCNAELLNPNGFDGFTKIESYHQQGMTDDNVRAVSFQYSVNTSVIPSIFCQTFQHLTNFLMTDQKLLTEVGPNGLRACTLLTHLDLSKNAIRNVDGNAFSTNRFLREINLASNRLQSLPDNVFASAPNLRIVRLQNNFLRTIQASLFAGNLRVDNFYLENNVITSVSPDFIDRPKFNLNFEGNVCGSFNSRNETTTLEVIRQELHFCLENLETDE